MSLPVNATNPLLIKRSVCSVCVSACETYAVTGWDLDDRSHNGQVPAADPTSA